MEDGLAELERAWLAAEATADELKEAATRAQESDCAGEDADCEMSQTTAEELAAQHVAAERAATEAFDRLWSAKGYR